MGEVRTPAARELLRLEVERRARAEFYRDRAARRAAGLGEVERKLRREAGPARRLTVAVLGGPAVRRLAVAARGVARFRPGSRGPGRSRASVTEAGGVTGGGREALEEAMRERRLAETGLRREHNRLGDVEWRLRIHRLHPRRGAQRLLARLGSLLAGSRAALALGAHRAVAPPVVRLLARRARRAPAGLDPPPGGWPQVTAVLHGRSLAVIARAWRLLGGTAYPALTPVIIGRRGADERFDPGVAEAIRSANTELMLVCGDVGAPDRDWLARLVIALAADERIGAVSPTGAETAEGSAIAFDLEAGAPVPRRSTRPVALTGECILIRAAALEPEAICGEYTGDLWAVDACIAMRQAGWSIGEVEAQVSRGPVAGLDPADVELLRSRWGPLLRRRVLADLANGGGEWCGRGINATSDSAGDPVLDSACSRLGWQLTGGAEEADLELSLQPEGDGRTIAARWMLPTGEPGVPPRAAVSVRLDEREVDETADRLRRAVIESASRMSFVIRLGARDWSAAVNWGDYFLAAALRDSLVRRGHDVLLQVAEEQGSAPGSCLDMLLHLRGRRPTQTSPGQLNLVWQISHPAETSIEELEAYDAVLVASRSYAGELGERLTRPVHAFLQFTDPARFFPRSEPDHAHELLFVGNWRYVFRRAVWDVLPTDRDLALIGQGWSYLAPGHLVAEHVPNAELARFYASCSILLCDHWDDMRERGFVSNRIFDALACGAFVISDHFEALTAEFDGAVETYREPGELREKVSRYLGDPEARRERARRGRELVLESHTAEHRVDELLRLLPLSASSTRRPFVAALPVDR